MAIRQIYQAKALKELQEGSPNPEVSQELRSATDYSLWALKFTGSKMGNVYYGGPEVPPVA